jgi:uncharacterized protein (TIGR03382 family)
VPPAVQRLMPFTCDFGGSYYNSEPWTSQPCEVEVAVPEGCPIHIIASGPVDLSNISTMRVPATGDATFTPNTATIVGSDDVTFSVMDVWSCDCAQTNIHVLFEHIELDVPDAVAGERVAIWGTGRDHDIFIMPPGPCVTPEWPSGYSAALACDRCPDPDDYDDDHHDDGGLDIDVGCSAGSDASPLILVGVAFLMLRRRRSR